MSTELKWVHEDKYAWCHEGDESYQGPCDTLEEAISEAEEGLAVGDSYNIARCTHPINTITDSAAVIGRYIDEWLGDMMCEEVGGDEPAVKLTVLQRKELGQLVYKFAIENGDVMRWGVKNETKHTKKE